MQDYREFFRSYIETALWASIGPDGDTPVGDNYGVFEGNISLSCYLKLARVAKNFLKDAHEELQLLDYDNQSYTNLELAAHDLWLTQNGHGAGFWDRGLAELGDRLTDKAMKLGCMDLYVGDNGLLYVS